MYYIEADVTIDKNFMEKPTMGFHIAGRLTIDYINNNMVLELASWENRQAFYDKESSLVTFLTINDCPRFNVDPSLFALRCLTSTEGSPFYRKEVKCLYELEHLSNIWVGKEE